MERSGIWGAADEAVLNIVQKKKKMKMFFTQELRQSGVDQQIPPPSGHYSFGFLSIK